MPYAPIWRRFVAYLIDCFLLMLILMIIGFAFTDWLAAIGNWGRLITLVLSWFYFSVQDSAEGGGQTFGKKLLKIEVRQMDGALPSLRTSMTRSLPIALLCAGSGMSTHVEWVNLLIEFAFASAFFLILYMAVFYRKHGRLPQDFLARTVVVMENNRSFSTIPDYGPWLKRGAVCCLLVAAAFSLFLMRGNMSQDNRNIAVVVQKIQENSGLKNVDIEIQQTTRDNKNYLLFNAWVNEKQQVNEATAARLANAALTSGYINIPSGMQFTVNLGTGFKLGLAYGVSWTSFHHTQTEWMALAP